MSNNDSDNDFSWGPWIGAGIAAISAIFGYFLGKESYEKAFEAGKAEGYAQASEKYEEKFRQQASEYLAAIEELQSIIKQKEENSEALKEKLRDHLEKGSRLIGEYEGLEKRYNELKKKLSGETQKQFSSLKAAWEKLKAA